MNQTYVIKQALLSEKTYKQMETGVYTFLVAKEATKNEIAKAVEKQFSVKVKSVNVSHKPAKQKRIGRTRKFGQTGQGKKAIVYLGPGQSIEMLSPKAKGKPKKEQKPQEPRPTKEVEKKKGIFARLKNKKEQDK